MNRRNLLLGFIGALGLGVAAAIYASGERPATTVVVETAPAQCDLVDNGRLKPIDPVRFTAAHPERFSKLFGIGLTDRLQDACDTLLGQGFTLEDSTEIHVDISNVGDLSDDRTGHFTRITRLRGPVTNPLDGAPAEATIHMVASSPATHSSVEYIDVQVTHDPALSVEAWKDQVTAYFGAPSHLDMGGFPSWVLSGDSVESGAPADLCDPELADYRAGWWAALPEIDPSRDVPAHDGGSCTLLVLAEVFGSEDDPALVGRTRLTMIDYASISANRRAENAHVRSLQYPLD